jgi:diazepam-binding inhibitor (GABA receptor modulating acyl-CoA-binding protein)
MIFSGPYPIDPHSLSDAIFDVCCGMGAAMKKIQEQFGAAQADAQKLTERPDNETLLELYSFYKQATDGDVTGEKPGAFDFKARAKYDAWEARKGMSQEVAMKAYIKLVNHLKSR